MSKHTPAVLTFALSLAAATTLMAQAPAADVDAITPTRAAAVEQTAEASFVNTAGTEAAATPTR